MQSLGKKGSKVTGGGGEGGAESPYERVFEIDRVKVGANEQTLMQKHFESLLLTMLYR